MHLSRAFGVSLAALIVALVHSTGLLGQRGQPPPTAAPVPPPLTGTAFLSGQVVETMSGRPVAGAMVAVIGPVGGMTGRAGTPPALVLTDSQGRFFFANLPAGRYSFTQVSKPGYDSGTVRPIVLADAERVTGVRIRLVQLSNLSGTVRDDAGDPVVGTDVILFRRAVVNGRVTIGGVTTIRTDDHGDYRFSGVKPGQYFVCACRRDPIPFDGVLLSTLAAEPLQLMGLAARALRVGAEAATLDQTLRTFPPTFYPNSASVAQATRVTLVAGEEKTRLDIDVTPVRALRVSGTIVGAASPVTAGSIRLVPAGDDSDAAVALAPVLVQPDGRFDFAGVPPGRYVLRVIHTVTTGVAGAPSGAALQFLGARAATIGGGSGPPQSIDGEPAFWAAEPVNVGDEDVRGLSIPLRPLTTISGRVETDLPTPRATSSGIVIVEPMSPGLTSGRGRINADGTFRVAGLMPGRYAISANLAGLSAASVKVGGADVTDMAFNVGADDVTGVEISVSNTGQPVINGAAPRADGATSDDRTVLAFPSDRKYWTEPAAARRLFRAIQIGRDDTFVTSLPAGEYFLAIVPDDAVADWQEASRLDALSRTAERVQLTSGEKKVVVKR